uniref:Uncharacterized protein n=1 Tax=Rhizophora mucronata TaxID=61149 RepID=A0A2P2LKV5_RHIMU
MLNPHAHINFPIKSFNETK